MAARPKSFTLSPEVHAYLVENGSPPDALARELIAETQRLGDISIMQVAPEQGAFLTWLTRALEVRHAVEVGTFTGYSALCIARGLAEGGRLIACDISEEWTSIGRRYWERAGVARKIDLRLAPAIETLRALPESPLLDLAFIDADKSGYPDYYEAILERLRAGGVILVDNVLWSGRVADPDVHDENTDAIRRFNAGVASDPRVDCVMLPLADGLTLLRKRER
jgi:predicted O-methyltransferase YrrM